MTVPNRRIQATSCTLRLRAVAQWISPFWNRVPTKVPTVANRGLPAPSGVGAKWTFPQSRRRGRICVELGQDPGARTGADAEFRSSFLVMVTKKREVLQPGW